MPTRSRHGTPEYRLLVTPHYNERRQLPTTLVLLETMQYFATFRYELSVEVRQESKRLSLKVLGLQAPDLSLPAPGHARFSREFDNLRGKVEFRFEGLDKRVATFTLRIGERRIQIVTPPQNGFVELAVDPRRWPLP